MDTEGLGIVEAIRRECLLGGPDLIETIMACGSLRRGKAEIGDVDLVVLPKPGMEEAVGERLRALFGTQVNGKPQRSGLFRGVQVDVNLTTKESFGAAIMFLTGSAMWNVMMRSLAKKQHFLLNEKGLFEIATMVPKGKKMVPVLGRQVAGETEESIFEALGMEFVQPEDREVE